MTVNCHTTGHIHSQTVMEAFAAGLGQKPRKLLKLPDGDLALYGFLRGSEPVLRQAQRLGRNWYYGDNGYFRPGHYKGFYRFTKNNYQHSGVGFPDFDRWKRLGIKLEPWKKGRHVLICPPGDVMAKFRGFDAGDWLANVIADLVSHTDRPVRIREKGSRTPLRDDLEDCHAVVTALSNAAVDAVIAGVPVFCTHSCAARVMGLQRLSDIESPVYPDREGWAAVLAANQWTLAEMRDGVAARGLGIGH